MFSTWQVQKCTTSQLRDVEHMLSGWRSVACNAAGCRPKCYERQLWSYHSWQDTIRQEQCEKTATSGSERLNVGSAADVYWILTRVDVEQNAVSVKKCASFQGRDVEQMCSCWRVDLNAAGRRPKYHEGQLSQLWSFDVKKKGIENKNSNFRKVGKL